jgi:purine-cytosine permease-like protein
MAKRSWINRVGNEVETVGVLPIPDSQRTMTPGKLFNVWAMASASVTAPLIGLLLFPFGLWYIIAAMAISWLVGVIPVGIFSEMGREIPLTALIVARKTDGTIGAFLFSLLFTVVNIGWFGLNTEVVGQILSALFHQPDILWFWIIGIVQVILVLFGMKWLEYFYRYTSLLLVVCYTILTVYLFTHFPMPAFLGPTKPVEWGIAISTIVSFSILSWTYKVSTVSRFCVPKKSSKFSGSYFLAPSIGIMLPFLLMGVVGFFSQKMTGNWNVALLGPHMPIWGLIAAIGVSLAIIHTNAMNLYPSTVDILVALNTLHKNSSRWEQPVTTAILGLFAILLAMAGILDKAQSFFNMVGDTVIPFSFIMIADWLWVQKKRTKPEEFFDKPKQMKDWISWAGVISFLVGFSISFWGTYFLPPFFYDVLPLQVIGGLISTVLYVILEIPAIKSNEMVEVIKVTDE